jgi:hypothetical protein
VADNGSDKATLYAAGSGSLVTEGDASLLDRYFVLVPPV